MTQGQGWLNQFQKQMEMEKPQPQIQSIAPTPLSNKTGINNIKKTQLQQGMIQALSTPQIGQM